MTVWICVLAAPVWVPSLIKVMELFAPAVVFCIGPRTASFVVTPRESPAVLVATTSCLPDLINLREDGLELRVQRGRLAVGSRAQTAVGCLCCERNRTIEKSRDLGQRPVGCLQHTDTVGGVLS